MTLSRDEAAKALDEIGVASIKVRRLRYYRDSAPIFMMWGAIWLFANTMIGINWQWVTWAWLVPSIPGMAVSIWFGNRHSKLNISRLSPEEKASQPNMAIIATSAWLAFAGVITVLWPVDFKQMNAVISLFFAGLYAIAGSWLGWRCTIIGAALGVGTLFGYFTFHYSAYFFWMGALGFAALTGGGYWMRKA